MKKMPFHTIALATYFKLQLKQIERAIYIATLLLNAKEHRYCIHSFHCFGGKLQNGLKYVDCRDTHYTLYIRAVIVLGTRVKLYGGTCVVKSD